MIVPGTIVNVADNSGARKAFCISVLDGSKRKYAITGGEVVVAVRGCRTGGVVKDGDVSRAVVVRTKKESKNDCGEPVRFSDNAVVLIDNNCNMRGSRVFGPISREVKKKGKYNKIISLASEVI